jgi:flavin-dependent dehydrogenase
MNVVGNGVTVLPEMDTGEGLDAMAVSDDEDGSADEEFAGAEVETTAEVDVVVAEKDNEVEGKAMDEMVEDEVNPGMVDVGDVIVGVDGNGERIGDDMREDEPEDELSELGHEEDHKGVLELESVLAPVVSEFAIEDEELELDNG